MAASRAAFFSGAETVAEQSPAILFNNAASEVFCSRTTLSSDLVAVVDASEAVSDAVATADSLRAAESYADPCSLNEADSDTETLTDVEVLADVDALADSVVDSVVD